MKIYLDYDTAIETGSNDNLGDGTPWSGYSHTITSLYPNFLTFDPGKCSSYIKEEFEWDNQFRFAMAQAMNDTPKIWLLVARYASGDTFSESQGKFEFLGLYNTELEAQSAANKIDGKDRWSDFFGGFEGFEYYALEVR